jgi:hypothetical protein
VAFELAGMDAAKKFYSEVSSFPVLTFHLNWLKVGLLKWAKKSSDSRRFLFVQISGNASRISKNHW